MTEASAAFPDLDTVGPPFELADDPLSTLARSIASDALAPSAAQRDRDGVTRETLAALGPLLGLAHPADGGTVAPAQWREVSELLAGADGTVWFCWSQHHPLIRAITMTLPYAGEHLASLLALRDDLARGRRFAALSFSHVRRPGAPPLTVEREAEGWRLTGHVDWVTAWDVADVVLVLAEWQGQLVHLAVDTAPRPTLHAGERLELMALGGSHTRPVTFTGDLVPNDRLVGIHPKAQWLALDDRVTVQPNPAAFGLARGAAASLARAGALRGDDRTSEAADLLAAQIREQRASAYEAIDSGSASPEELLDLRSRVLDLAVRATALALTASGGRAMERGGDDERRYREAAFLLVQRQTPATRAASLGAWTAGDLAVT